MRGFQQICHKLNTAFLKPHLPAISRFLTVATFYEDAIRICYQWPHQTKYLMLMHHLTRPVAITFLVANVLIMTFFATCIISRKMMGVSVSVLTLVMAIQAFAYGILFDTYFFLRNLSVLGGLLLCLSESILSRTKVSNDIRLWVAMPLQHPGTKECYQYIQLAGRTLTVLVFFAYLFIGDGGKHLTSNVYFRLLIAAVGLTACSMIIIGFKAKYSATILLCILCLVNILANNWWDGRYSTYRRDFLRYDFFQYLSIIGGLMTLVATGPGGLSYDEQKKRKQF
ncbi:SURF4 family-domain-containing protein [Mycotypha africana]|uniref:SURF4 family-domain-containing protein n=1 Tax=Mycotypha africana TaxID=64632 RepID=UPI0023015AF8|nr:SURF4 family-domain-containing protein [Mycotypha africana]KAI8982073.1 SURF4 family-domain-containing protein [Mycotypha africana]